MNLIKCGILFNLISISNEAFWLVRSKKDISAPNSNPKEIQAYTQMYVWSM